MLAWCSMLHSLKFDMQHDHALKKLNTDPLTRVVNQGWGSAREIFATKLLLLYFPLI